MPGEKERIVPIVEEDAAMDVRRQITDTVRIAKRAIEENHRYEVPVTDEELTVERIPIDRVVEEPQTVRQDGDTTIIPVQTEEVVIAKRIRLVEEVRVTRHRTVRLAEGLIPVARERVSVSRRPGGTDDEGDSPRSPQR